MSDHPGYIPPPGSVPTLSVPDLSGVRSVHLVGIGGAGMSGIARLLLARGVSVSGCDLKESKALTRLRAIGAEVEVGHGVDHLTAPDAVVASTAIPGENEEIQEAARRGIPVHARAQVLAALMRERTGVAVAGTHGKTTTTSMLAVILERAGLDPTYVVGGDLNESGSNARSGGGALFVAEADESDGSFLLLTPEVALVTNVEGDHLDFYADVAEVEAAFVAFCRRSGRVVACGDDPGARRVVAAAGAGALTYGAAPDNHVVLHDVAVSEHGGQARLRVGERTVPLRIPLPGRHQLVNAAGAIATASVLGVAPDKAAAALAGFGGVRRRFERRGSVRGADFVDDYAHHPTEIAATLGAAQAIGAGRVVAVFQPHRYSRTAALGRDLGESLADADLVVVTDVYGAGELPMPGVTGKVVVDALLERRPHKRTVYLPHRADLAPFLARQVRDGDLVLTLGAGDITMVADETLALLRYEVAGGAGPR